MEKICHVTSAHPPEDGRIFRRACISSVKAGFQTYLIQPGESYRKNGVHIVGLGKPKKTGRLYRMTLFAKYAYEKALAVDADLYHLHDPELLCYAKRLKKQGKAVIFDSHENYVEQIKNKSYLPKILASAASKLYDNYSKKVFLRIDGLTYAGNGESATIFDTLCRRVVPTDNLPWLSELYDKYNPEVAREEKTACYIGGLDAGQRQELLVKMAEAGVACNVHYKPLPLMSAYKALGFDISDYPNAYDRFVNEITLPLHTKLTDEEVEYVVEKFKDICKSIN